MGKHHKKLLNNLEELRKSAGFTQQELSVNAEVSRKSINAIENGKVQYAGLDVFETEPTPAVQLLMNPEISLTPHIGASTLEAQDRIGTELASQIIELLK